MLTKKWKILIISAWMCAAFAPAQENLFEDEFFRKKTSFGAYGELHLNYNSDLDSTILDFHRLVLFMGYAWSPVWHFKLELELEHNFVKDGQGEIELEQAYILYQPQAAFGVGIGVVLASVGLINEYHEPPLFPSVERPIYHKNIIPTTWFGNGVMLGGIFKQKIEYRLNIMEGLNFDKIKAESGIRSSRQKGYKSDFSYILANMKVDYIGLPGLRAGLSLSRSQSVKKGNADKSLTLYEGHIKYTGKEGIYASGEVGIIDYDSGLLELSLGYYLDFGYNFGIFFKKEGLTLMPWARWSDISPDFKTSGGETKDKANRIRLIEVGLTYKPISFIALKIDYGYMLTGDKNEKRAHLANAGMGFYF